MKMRSLALAIALSAAVASPVALAEKAHGGNHQFRGNFVTDVTRTTGSGQTMSRHTQQVRTEAGVRRESSFTNRAGDTASRTVDAGYDAATQTRTRTMEQVRASGETVSSQRIMQRTEAGYQRSVERSNSNGVSVSKDVDMQVDRDNQTLTKQITATGPNGDVRTATVVKSYRGEDMESGVE